MNKIHQQYSIVSAAEHSTESVSWQTLILVLIRSSALGTVKPDNNKHSRLKEENPALLEEG